MEFGGKMGELLGGENSTVWSGMSDIYDLESQLAQVRREREREVERDVGREHRDTHKETKK